METEALGEVIFEYVQIGTSVRVTAIHAATGTEVIVPAPVSLSPLEMQQLALLKLRYMLKKKGNEMKFGKFLLCGGALICATQALAQTPPVTVFMDTFKQISAVDLREIDHVAQIAGTKSTIAPEMIDQDGKQILGWADISFTQPSEMFKKPSFSYTVAIQGAQYKITDAAMRNAIVYMSFKDFSSVGCIDGDRLEKYFNQLSVRQYTYHDTGYEASYDVNKGDGFLTKATAHFNKGDPCLSLLSLTELTNK